MMELGSQNGQDRNFEISPEIMIYSQVMPSGPVRF